MQTDAVSRSLYIMLHTGQKNLNPKTVFNLQHTTWPSIFTLQHGKGCTRENFHAQDLLKVLHDLKC